MRVPRTTVPANVDWIGSMIAREKQGKPRVARAYCQDCPIKAPHRADLVIFKGDVMSVETPVCELGWRYNFEKLVRKTPT